MAKTDTNIRVELVKTNKSLLGETEITNGCVWFVDDTKELFFDFDSKRNEVKDILILEKESERTSILFVPLNKFYFVLETKILWLYKDGNWYQVSQSTTPGTTPSSISISDLSKISTGLSISVVDNKVAVSSGHVVDNTATKVLKLESPMNKTLFAFTEGNGNGGMSSLSGDLIPALTSNSDTGLIYGSVSTGSYVQPYFIFDKNESTTYYCQFYSGINESHSSYVGYEFSNIKPAGNYSIKYIAKNGSSSGTTELELYILTIEGNKELVYQNTNIDKSWQNISASINISKPFTAIYVANDSTSYLTYVAEFYIYAESSNIQNIYIIAKDDDTTDICIGDNIPSGFIYSKQIGKITLNEDYTQIIDFLPKTDLATLYVNEELALKSDIPTDYATKNDIKTVVNVTYSELVDLKTNNQLEEGMLYRITDYVTTTNGNSADSTEPSRSAGHQFDIIVQALGPSNLSEVCSCALHEGDTYFENQNIGAWQVWYDINNDTSKYTWAVTDGTGKGVIYRMIDENLNDLPYDFKNIQFYRDKTLSKYSNFTDRMTAEDGYYYTFCDTTTSPVSDYSVTGSKGISNTTMSVDSFKAPKLNNILFLFNSSYKYCQNVLINTGTYNCTFAHSSSVNINGAQSYNIHIAGCMDDVIIGGGCYNISATNIYTAKFGLTVNNINITGSIYNANFKYKCKNITVGSNCVGVYLGANSSNITIGNSCFDIDIGTYSSYITVGNSCQYITTGFLSRNITVGNYNVYLEIKSNTRYINCPTSTSGSRFMNYILNYGLLGSSDTNRLDLTGLPTNTKYPINIRNDENGRVLATWNNLGVTKGKYKESVTATEWKDIVPEYYTTTEIDTKLGDISSILDNINGEV